MIKSKAVLEIFPSDSVVHDLWQFNNLSQVDEDHALTPTFVRDLDIIPPYFSLKSVQCLLAITDRKLKGVAEACEAEVVPHRWGLVAASSAYSRYHPRRFPEWSLAARVDRIQPHTSPGDKDNIPDHVRSRLEQGLRRNNTFFRRLRRYSLSDMHSGQFMYGTNAAQLDTNQVAKLYLVDIEPLYQLRTGIL